MNKYVETLRARGIRAYVSTIALSAVLFGFSINPRINEETILKINNAQNNREMLSALEQFKSSLSPRKLDIPKKDIIFYLTRESEVEFNKRKALEGRKTPFTDAYDSYKIENE